MLPVLLALVVGSTTTVLASPSVPPVKRASACRHHECEAARLCGDRLAALHSIIQLQAHTTQGCIQPSMTPQTTPAPLQSIIEDLRQTVERLTQTIDHSLEQSAALSTTPAPSPATNKTNILHDVIVNLTNVMQQQYTTHLELISALRNITMKSSDCGHESGYIYNMETESCYKYHVEKLKWLDGSDVCVREGAHLAVINGRREAAILGDMVKESGSSYAALGYRLDSDGVWRAVSGETVKAAATYSPWRPGWPWNESKSMYAGIWADGFLVNEATDLEHTYICEKRPHTYIKIPLFPLTDF